jgi:methyl-accepting chemotaxis protein
LAQRSAEAARQIKLLITRSNQQVSTGVELVGSAGGALARILAQVSQINSVVSQIANSAQTQAAALAEVNTAMNRMDGMNQQNAAMVEQSTAAIGSLADDTDHLAALVGRFKVGRRMAQQQSDLRPVTALRA